MPVLRAALGGRGAEALGTAGGNFPPAQSQCALRLTCKIFEQPIPNSHACLSSTHSSPGAGGESAPCPGGALPGHSGELPCPPYCYHLLLSACGEVAGPLVGSWTSSGTSVFFSHLRMLSLTSMSNKQFILCLTPAGRMCDSSWVVNTGPMTAANFKTICFSGFIRSS